MTTSPAGYAIVGRIRKAHGIRGEVVVEPITDAPDAIFASGHRVFAGTATGDISLSSPAEGAPPVPRALDVIGARAHQGGLLVQFDAIHDRTEAELWRGRYLLVPADELEAPAEGEVFLHELPGMTAVLEAGNTLGEVTAWYELPQGILLAVQGVNG
jgi:16S rRNA processing protein RimM